jgi:competence protein ComGC
MKINKKRTLILTGILVLIFGSLHYFFNFSDTSDKLYKEQSQTILNSLVADIEYYKLENNQYPDSLSQLVSIDKFIFIGDPLQSKANTNFNYKKVGEKYLLFSSGKDEIENTNDDLYPKIRNLKNVGWIKSCNSS